jgi:hypothetical protein
VADSRARLVSHFRNNSRANFTLARDTLFDTAPTTAVAHVIFPVTVSKLTEIRLKKTPPTSAKRLGEHENALFAKWLSARRDKLKRATTADRSNTSAQLKQATQ